jgi:hypothetical protein
MSDWLFGARARLPGPRLHHTRRLHHTVQAVSHVQTLQPAGAQLREVAAARTAILGREVLAVDADARPRFMDLLRGTGRLIYAAFDILMAGRAGPA